MIPKIQIISTPQVSNEKFPNMELSLFNKFKTFDSFKINIINLNNIYALSKDYNNTFLFHNDYLSLMKNISENNDNIVLLILPQNIELKDNKLIKNNLNLIDYFNKEYMDFNYFSVVYGENLTKINGFELKSDFFFNNYEGYESLTENLNGKPTTIKKEKHIITTLNITNEEDLISFLKLTRIISIESPVPDWFDDILMFDDEKQIMRIEKNTSKINELENDNQNANDVLKQNNEYKSILYKQSDELVSVVFKIFEDILNCNLSEFKDVYKEDLLVKLDDVTFVGEIKGVSRNVSIKHLSQLDNHITDREYDLIKSGKRENLKPLLIMNTFLNNPPDERPEVEDVTIEKAINKYGTLIITSIALLELYEKYRNGEIDTQTIINRFKDETGLFIP